MRRVGSSLRIFETTAASTFARAATWDPVTRPRTRGRFGLVVTAPLLGPLKKCAKNLALADDQSID